LSRRVIIIAACDEAAALHGRAYEQRAVGALALAELVA
jgi:hypothetical protein